MVHHTMCTQTITCLNNKIKKLFDHVDKYKYINKLDVDPPCYNDDVILKNEGSMVQTNRN